MQKRIILIFFFILPHTAFCAEFDLPENEPIFAELRLETLLLTEEFDLYKSKDKIYVPIGGLSQKLEIAINTFPEQGLAKGYVINEKHKFHLDLKTGIVRSGDKTFSIPEDKVITQPDDLYVDI